MKTNQKGFTLIEIIAVLVILGILAAVAAPRYFDMIDQARRRAALGVVAELQARVNLRFSTELMENGGDCVLAVTTVRTLTNLTDSATNEIGVWQITNDWTADGTDEYTIDVVHNVEQGYDVTLNPLGRIFMPLCN